MFILKKYKQNLFIFSPAKYKQTCQDININKQTLFILYSARRSPLSIVHFQSVVVSHPLSQDHEEPRHDKQHREYDEPSGLYNDSPLSSRASRMAGCWIFSEIERWPPCCPASIAIQNDDEYVRTTLVKERLVSTQMKDKFDLQATSEMWQRRESPQRHAVYLP